jgi:hypothetical protein
MVDQDIVSRIRNIEFRTIDDEHASSEDLLRLVLSFDVYMNGHHYCLPDDILNNVTLTTLHIQFQNLSIEQHVNISVRYLETLIDTYLSRSYTPYILLLQDVLQYIEDISDMCM